MQRSPPQKTGQNSGQESGGHLFHDTNYSRAMRYCKPARSRGIYSCGSSRLTSMHAATAFAFCRASSTLSASARATPMRRSPRT